MLKNKYAYFQSTEIPQNSYFTAWNSLYKMGRVKRIWYLSLMRAATVQASLRIRAVARTSAARSYKQCVKRNLQTENQIPGPSELLGMRS